MSWQRLLLYYMEMDLIKQAINGNKNALEHLIASVKDKIYNLSIRYLWNPMDAEDATQEILIKVITNLSTFEGKSYSIRGVSVLPPTTC